MRRPESGQRAYIVAALLAALTLIAFWQVLKCQFVNFDDDHYVLNNPHVLSGLTIANIKWAFTTLYESFWMPTIWLSFMLDQQMYGLNPFGYHLTNLLFHIANVVLLFLVLRRMTKSTWRSALVAALFAVHPLHVESVAWVTERKDLVSTLFYILTMGAYALYAERPDRKRYSLVVLMLALGLMSKTTLVTLPFVLLLLDYWPLRRFAHDSGKRADAGVMRRLILEKAPLALLCIGATAVSFLAQRASNAVSSFDAFSMTIRVKNAFVSYVEYIAKMLWPAKLAVFYPHPLNTLPMWQVVGSGILLACITVLVLAARRSRPHLAVGWLWYLGTLIPMIGLVQLGWQSMADRYTYVPLTGLFIAIVWSIPEPFTQVRRVAVATISGIVLTVLTALTWVQAGCWHDSFALFSHALAVTQRNFVAHNNLGTALAEEKRYGEAVDHFQEAVRIFPGYAYAYNNLGNSLLSLGRRDEAIKAYSEAVHIKPTYDVARANLAAAVEQQGAGSLASGGQPETPDPASQSAIAHFNLGATMQQQGNLAQAVKEYRQAIKLKPDLLRAHYNLAVALFFQEDYAAAWKEVHECRKLGNNPDPNFVQALSDKMPDPGN